ncbi:MAG: efflux RND transporter permease subunit, partial [Gemmataceae bacterium]|nr:efflux RND transporter permease subunit [Gemmataceae bacterium]
MLSWIIDVSLRNRWLVLLVALLAAGGGVLSVRALDVDAFPDTTPVQVQINTAAPALAPVEVERQITAPLEQALGGLPKLRQMRSVSKFGLSQIVLIFEDGTDVYFARQVVNERLGRVKLPAGLNAPQLGPVSTGLGEIFHYVVAGQGNDVTDLRTTHDWVIRPQLRTVPGVAEVNSWGGYDKQFQVRIDPPALVKYGLTFDQV